MQTCERALQEFARYLIAPKVQQVTAKMNHIQNLVFNLFRNREGLHLQRSLCLSAFGCYFCLDVHSLMPDVVLFFCKPKLIIDY
jgi:hypothetical protein